MWCNHCQQDVPGVTFSANQAVIGCARCGHVFRGSEHDSVEFLPIQNAPEMAVAESREPDLIDSNLSPLDEFHDFGDEDFEQALADAQRLLEPSSASEERESDPSQYVRCDSPDHATGPAGDATGDDEIDIMTSMSRTARQALPSRREQTTQRICWALLAVGLAVFVCGASLMGLALMANRPPLWQLGLPLMLGGQVAVLAVVISQLEWFWQSEHRSSTAIQQLEEQLRQFRDVMNRRERETEIQEGSERQRGIAPRPHIRVDQTRRGQQPLTESEFHRST
jgi:hypothetical protein